MVVCGLQSQSSNAANMDLLRIAVCKLTVDTVNPNYFIRKK